MDSVYIHGTTESEQNRLSVLNAFINDNYLKEINLQGGERILDVGSGLGQFTRLLKKSAGPEAYVLGIERETQQIEKAKALAEQDGESNLVEIRQGSGYNLPLQDTEGGSSDVVHTRFLLEHVPDPLRIVQQMAKAVKPGGRVILSDDDHDVLRLYPEPPGVMEVWRAYIRTYDRLGNDPFIGRRLVSLLHQAGLQPVRNGFVFFGGCAGEEKFDNLVMNLAEVIRSAREAVLTQHLCEAAYFDQAIETLYAWGQRPDVSLWYPLCFAEGRG